MQSDSLPREDDYSLDQQVGFILRRVTQRHLSIFAAHIPDLTPMQFAVLAKLRESGPLSQNALGRATAMDAATIKGVVDRLRQRDLVEARPGTVDQRRLFLDLTDEGRAMYQDRVSHARAITQETLSPLSASERRTLLALLGRMT